ncbi:MAG: hypothetical protein CM15mP104_0730 [Gammaproteobacteria bacterium]|nr:MAG: hypothetical protein CM15mP104_0730 [Gammaproteobacteria bacterium]
MRGSRVQSVSGELQNERIDIIIYEDNPAQMVLMHYHPPKLSQLCLMKIIIPWSLLLMKKI